MKTIYGVYHGKKGADSDCTLYTENLSEALEEAKYISKRVTKAELKKGYFVEVEKYDVDDDITTADFEERYPDADKEEKILEALGNHDTAYYFDYENC